MQAARQPQRSYHTIRRGQGRGEWLDRSEPLASHFSETHATSLFVSVGSFDGFDFFRGVTGGIGRTIALSNRVLLQSFNLAGDKPCCDFAQSFEPRVDAGLSGLPFKFVGFAVWHASGFTIAAEKTFGHPQH